MIWGGPRSLLMMIQLVSFKAIVLWPELETATRRGYELNGIQQINKLSPVPIYPLFLIYKICTAN